MTPDAGARINPSTDSGFAQKFHRQQGGAGALCPTPNSTQSWGQQIELREPVEMGLQLLIPRAPVQREEPEQ